MHFVARFDSYHWKPKWVAEGLSIMLGAAQKSSCH